MSQPSFDQVADFHSLCRSARKAAQGKNLTRESAAFLFDLEPEVLRLERELRGGGYRPRDYRTFTIREPKPRTISAASFRDRVVHHALCAALEPVFENTYIDASFACRVGKGNRAAVEYAQQLASRHRYFLKLDIEHFFETMDHEVLLGAVEDVIEDRRINELVATFVKKGAPGSPLGTGQPIGNLTSQHFANFYLTACDWLIVEEFGVSGYCRYMDDMLVFGDHKQSLWRWKASLQAFLLDKLKIRLKQSVTCLAPVSEGVPFLGFRIWPRLIRLDPKRARRLRRPLRKIDRRLVRDELTEDEAASSAQSLLGWAEQADARRFCISFFNQRDAVT